MLGWSCPTTGKFDKARLRRIIADAGLTVDEFMRHLGG
jgi:hypothetical protein